MFEARLGTLEHFLTERYCLYTLDKRRRVHRAEIHHPPWHLQQATADFELNTMTAPYGIDLPAETPLSTTRPVRTSWFGRSSGSR